MAEIDSSSRQVTRAAWHDLTVLQPVPLLSIRAGKPLPSVPSSVVPTFLQRCAGGPAHLRLWMLSSEYRCCLDLPDPAELARQASDLRVKLAAREQHARFWLGLFGADGEKVRGRREEAETQPSSLGRLVLPGGLPLPGTPTESVADRLPVAVNTRSGNGAEREVFASFARDSAELTVGDQHNDALPDALDWDRPVLEDEDDDVLRAVTLGSGLLEVNGISVRQTSSGSGVGHADASSKQAGSRWSSARSSTSMAQEPLETPQLRRLGLPAERKGWTQGTRPIDGGQLPPAAAVLRLQTRHELSLLRLTACGVALSPCGRFLAVGDFTGQVLLFDMQSVRKETSIGHAGASGSSSGDGVQGPSSEAGPPHEPGLGAGSHRAPPRCFRVARRAKMLQAVRSLAWHPNGTVLAVGCMDGTIVLWHAFSGAVGPCVRLDGNVTAMRFQPSIPRGGPPKLAAATTSGRVAIVEVDVTLHVLPPAHQDVFPGSAQKAPAVSQP